MYKIDAVRTVSAVAATQVQLTDRHHLQEWLAQAWQRVRAGG